MDSIARGDRGRIHDLPGMRFTDVVGTDASEVEAAVAVPRYFAAYERQFALPVHPRHPWSP